MFAATAGATLIGTALYATRGKKDENEIQRHPAQQKRELGLSGGVGVGGNARAGGPEKGSSPAGRVDKEIMDKPGKQPGEVGNKDKNNSQESDKVGLFRRSHMTQHC